jgi:hypothetical protein
MDQSIFLSFDEIVSVIKAHHKQGIRRTILIEGENGIGKTAVYHALRNDPMFANHIAVDPIDATQLSDGSVWMPDIDREAGVSRELPNERFGLSKNNRLGVNGSRPVLCFIDEFAKAAPYVKNILAPLIYNYRNGDYHFPEGSHVIMGTNLGIEGLGDNIPAHIRNRLIRVKMRKPTLDETRAYAECKGWDYRVIATLVKHPQVFDSFLDYEEGGKYAGKSLAKDNPFIYNPREMQDAYASPRSFETASDIVKTLDDVGMNLVRAQLWGAVGSFAENICTTIRVGNTLPEFPLIVRDPHNAPLVKDPVAQIIQAQQFVQLANTREEAEAVTTYVERMREEIKHMFIAAISNSTKVTTFVRVEAFGRLLRESKQFLDLNN